MARRAHVTSFVAFVAASVLAAAQLGADCVDGVTPDCSGDAAATCGPTGLPGVLVLGNDGSATEASVPASGDAEAGVADADAGDG